jgi:hypothetical protein
LLVSWTFVDSLLHNVNICKNKAAIPQKHKVGCTPRDHIASARALYIHRFALRRPKYIQMSNK